VRLCVVCRRWMLSVGMGLVLLRRCSVVGFMHAGCSQAHFWQAPEMEKEKRGVWWWWLVSSRGPVVCGGIEMGAFIN